MKKKARISIKVVILIPVFILGIVAVFSNSGHQQPWEGKYNRGSDCG